MLGELTTGKRRGSDGCEANMNRRKKSNIVDRKKLKHFCMNRKLIRISLYLLL